MKKTATFKKSYQVNTVHDGVLGEFGNIKQAYSEIKLYADKVGYRTFELSYNQVCERFRSGYEKIQIREKTFGLPHTFADITITNSNNN